MAGDVASGQDESVACERDAVGAALEREATGDAARPGDGFAEANGVLEAVREFVGELLTALPEVLEGTELVDVAVECPGPKCTMPSAFMLSSTVTMARSLSLMRQLLRATVSLCAGACC